MTNRHAIVDTTLGDITLLAEDDALAGLYFEGHWYPPAAASLGERVDAASDPLLSTVVAQLAGYLSGARRAFDLPVVTHGGDFSERVWAMLLEIPYGETTTYGELAERLGNRAFAQRVGQAVGHNPVSLVIPCHRVVGRDGKLTGYAGGLERKRTLLDLEAPAVVAASRLF